MVSASVLEIANVSKTYGATTVVDKINISAQAGEFLTFLGPSGCGKTTLLRMVGGFIIPDEGHIRIAGREVTTLPPNRRDCGFVFQSYALFPHMTVAGNVGYGLKLRKVSPGDIEKRTNEVLAIVGLEKFADRYPRQLSGGQQQRVAIARAIAIRPSILLLDEPLSNLDAKLRERIRFELRELQKQLGITTIFVTHDQEEAMAVSDRIVVLNKGEVEQIGTPDEIYKRPRSHFVADFVGLNNIMGVDEASPGVGEAKYRTKLGVFSGPALSEAAQRTVTSITIRPEAVAIVGQDQPVPEGAQSVSGTISLAAFLGPVGRYEVKLANGEIIKAAAGNSDLLPTGTPVHCHWRPEDVWALSA